MVPKAERSDATRRALVDAARRLFAEHGFADTSTESIVQAAGVTRGALYHHFRDKTALFEAVYETLEHEVVDHVVSGIGAAKTSMERLRKGAEAFLDACLDPAVQRVVLVEGPSVLGWQRWREIDQAYGLGITKVAVQAAMDDGAIRSGPVDELSQVLLAALNEAAMMLAATADTAKTRRQIGAAIGMLIDGLATEPSKPKPKPKPRAKPAPR
jgi:AcrR family transcriptional regulator